MKKFIGVKTNFRGLHRWPDAPLDRPIWFLRNPHRHIFNITAHFEVTADDRQLEFFEAALHIDEVVEGLYGKASIKDLDNRSCETIALQIIEKLKSPYKEALVSMKVQEDDENYALIQV